MTELDEMKQRVWKMKEVVMQYGMIDGEHHKQWLIDQMLRAVFTEPEYERFIKEFNVPGYTPWDTGIAP